MIKHSMSLVLASAITSALASVAFAQAPSSARVDGAAAQQEASPRSSAQSTKKAKKKTESRPQSATATLSTVTVTGIQGSIENSLKVKQNSNEIVEAVSAEDIGKLPDVSIADSLARLPGVATQRVNGEANQISIRGLAPEFTGTTLDGDEQATIGENRGVDFDQYPAELISGATVYKTPNATLVGQGIAGTVDLHTIDPLDLPGRRIVITARGVRNQGGQLNAGAGPSVFGNRVSFSYVDQFFHHTLGVAIGIAHIDQPIQGKQYQAWWWGTDNGSTGMDEHWGTAPTPGMPDNVISQQGMQLRAQSEKQNRNGVLASVEWEPNEVYYSKLNVYYSKFLQPRYINGVQWSSSPFDKVSYADVGTTPTAFLPVVTSGIVEGIAPILQNEYTKEDDKLYSIDWKNDFYLGSWTLSTDVDTSSAAVQLHDAYLFMGVPGAIDGSSPVSAAFQSPVRSGYPSFTPSVNFANPDVMAFTDPDSYGYDGRQEIDHQYDRIRSARVQVSHPAGWIFSDVKVGLDYSQRVKTKHADVDFAYLNGNGSTTANYNPHLAVPIDQAYLYAPSSVSYGGIDSFINYDVLGAMYNQFYLVPRNGQGDWSRNYSVEERVPMAYVMGDIHTSLFGIPLRGNLGTQFVHTDQSSTALQTNGNTLLGTMTGGTTYNKFLPSLNLVATVGNNQYVRFGMSKTMTRPRIDDEKVAFSAGVSRLTSGPQAGQVVWSGSGGNAELKPYVGVETDLGWEKYFGRDTYVAADVFQNNLISYVYQKTVLNHDFSGAINDTPTLVPTSNFGAFTMPENGAGGTMRGLEVSGALAAGRIVPALDGFGLQANFALTNSELPTSAVSSIPGAPHTLPGLSRKVANLILYYERYGFSARVAERFRSQFTGEAVALFDQLGYTTVSANRETDLQLAYKFHTGRLKGLSLLFEISNLTNSPDATLQYSALADGEPINGPLEYDTWGRTILFGFDYSL